MKNELLKRLDEIKKTKNTDHEAIIQFKVRTETRDKLLAKLEKNKLTYKDFFQTAIDMYLEES